MPDPRQIVSELIAKHAQKAAESEYDRTVAIQAIAAVRETAAAVSDALPDDEYKAQILKAVGDLKERYHDPDGEYTSGKGVIGSCLNDLYLRFSG